MTSGATPALRVVTTVGVVVVAAIVLLALVWTMQRRLIYLPDRSPVPPAGEVVPDARDVTLTTGDGLELGAWHVTATDSRRDLTVLVANGNGGNRAGRAPLAVALAEAGFDVLLFDYRGYGGNPGDPSEEGLALDVRAARRFLLDEAGAEQQRLLYYGESLGCGVVTELATEHPPAGLLLRSPFADLASVGRRHYPFLPVGLLLRDRYPVADHVSTLDVPTTVVYGTADTIVPVEQSREVAASAAGAVDEVAVTGVGHNDRALFDGRQLIDAVIELADRAASP